MKLSIAPPLSIWEQGNRKNQEDAIYPRIGEATVDDKVFILCDGMGGHERGEVASNLVCDVLSSYIHDHWDGVGFTDSLLLDALNATMNELDKLNDDSDRRPGTTLTLLIFHVGGVFAAHIGDSRIYHIRPKRHIVLYKSRDHSLVYDMLASGEITVRDMENYSKKNVITRALMPGLERRPKPSIVHIADVQPGDYFYMCSDGMLEKMSDRELVKLLAKNTTDVKKYRRLVELTKNNKDNHSAHLIFITDVVREPMDEQLKNDEKESLSNALNLEKSASAGFPERNKHGISSFFRIIINKLRK